MREDVSISYRGAGYEIGRGQDFYGIWPLGAPRAQVLERWPQTPEGWYAAWSRFTGIEAPGTIVPVQPGGPLPAPSGRVRAPSPRRCCSRPASPAGSPGSSPAISPGRASPVRQADLVPHAIYLAAWAASAVLILLGGGRQRAGALLGTGTSAVTFGLFFADAGQAIAGGAHLASAGLVLGLAGWLGCAAGSAVAVGIRPPAEPGGKYGYEAGSVMILALAGLGAAVAFAPSWDSYTLRTPAGLLQSVTAGNAFANPAPVIAGDVAVMVALVAVAVVAAFWRPVMLGAALLAGAIIPMAAQLISALVQLGEGTSPGQFGISPAQATQAGLTISSGVTPAFWIYCAFVIALIAMCVRMLVPPRPVPPGAAQAPASPVQVSRQA